MPTHTHPHVEHGHQCRAQDHCRLGCALGNVLLEPPAVHVTCILNPASQKLVNDLVELMPKCCDGVSQRAVEERRPHAKLAVVGYRKDLTDPAYMASGLLCAVDQSAYGLTARIERACTRPSGRDEFPWARTDSPSSCRQPFLVQVTERPQARSERPF